MMATKIRDISVKTGEYTDRNTGQNKGQWARVGALMKNDDGSLFIIMERTFNPAGVPNPDNRATVLLSCFANDNNGAGQGGGQAPAQRPASTGPQMGGQPPAGGGQNLDDDIPF